MKTTTHVISNPLTTHGFCNLNFFVLNDVSIKLLGHCNSVTYTDIQSVVDGFYIRVGNVPNIIVLAYVNENNVDYEGDYKGDLNVTASVFLNRMVFGNVILGVCTSVSFRDVRSMITDRVRYVTNMNCGSRGHMSC